MLAHRLAARTVMTSERDVGTQTSLSFETSSSIRDELLAYLDEQEGIDDEEGDGTGSKDDGGARSYVRGVGDMTIAELRELHYHHCLDPNYDSALLEREQATLSRWDGSTTGGPSRPPSSYALGFFPSEGGNLSQVEDVYTEWGFDEGEEDSVYAEVRAAVSNTDDPTIPTNTLRVWVLGILGSITLAGVNQFFYYRYPSVTVASLIIQLISYPLGHLMAHVLPHGEFINPGPFNIKEHTLITIMAGVAQGTAYATNIITVQRYFYHQTWSFAYQIMLVLSTQLIGFSMGGLLRRFLVWPAAMIWPASLVSTALLNTLHSVPSGGVSADGGIMRDKFFFRVTGAMFIWNFFPTYLFTALSNFDWVTWIAPTNVIVNQVFGYQSGLGLSFITFDWGLISSIGNPLVMPWWACANIVFGFCAFVCVLYPSLYYTGAFDAWYLPFSSSGSFDNQGQHYNVTKILTGGEAVRFDEEKYAAYSQIFVPITFTMSYSMNFACLMATLVHTVLYYHKEVWRQARSTLHMQTDIHSRLMRKYREVPQWWYATVFLGNLALALGATLGWPTEMPAWALILALFIAFFFALPIGIVQAITNQQVGLNVISELIIGYLLPGRPICMMTFKTYSYITLAQGLDFVSDMKLGHYMKIPPRLMFTVQIVATVVGAFVQVGVGAWMYSHIPDMCDMKKRSEGNAFWCPSAQTFGTASIIWGVIGPSRQFSVGRIYGPVLYGFIAGTLAPLPFYFLARRNPGKWYKFINWPVVFSATSLMPPYLPINIISFCYTNFIFQYLVRKYRFVWWSRFNYILSAGWSAGYAISVILIFFAFSLPTDSNGAQIGNSTLLAWWGNTVYKSTADALGTPFKNLTEGQTFGDKTWA